MRNVILFLAGIGALGLAGCASHIVPLREPRQMEVWVPDEPATQPGSGGGEIVASTGPGGAETMPATVPGTVPATQPAGHMVVKLVDPNRTSRFVYKANYETVWQQAMALLTRTGFSLDHKDYRGGELTTLPLPAAQIIEVWKPQHVAVVSSLENTIHNQRRLVKLTISGVPGKPDFYEIGVQVLVARESNPTEEIGGPIFVEGSGFGRNSVTLRSDYAEVDAKEKEQRHWVVVGHDPDLEKKLIDALFERI